MNDRTPEQINNALDRSEQILVEQAQRMDNVTVTLDRIATLVERIGERTEARSYQHDLELDDHDERVERLEQNHLEHATRLSKLEDIQADMKVMLEILVRRSVGEANG
jgi:hypothetical protein